MLNTDPTEVVVADLATYGAVLDVISELNAVVLQTQEENLASIRSLPHVVSVNSDTAITIVPLNASRFVQSTTEDAAPLTRMPSTSRTLGLAAQSAKTATACT
jgi:hypothetical protein